MKPRAVVTLIAVPLLLSGVANALVTVSGSWARAARFLASEGRRIHSDDFASLAQEIQVSTPGDLDKVKVLIRQMLVNKLDEHAKATDAKQFCDSESGKSKESLQRLKDSIEKEQADTDMANAKFAELTDRVADLHEEHAKSQKAMTKAMELRDAEHKHFLESQAAHEQTEREMAAATAKLEGSGSESDIEATKAATEDAIKRRVEEESAENDRAFKYEHMTKQVAVAAASRDKEIEYKQREAPRMKLDMSHMDTDLRGMKDQLVSAQQYDDNLKRQCTVPATSHEDRHARRQAEIGSLKEAYGILSGNDIPVLSY